MIEYELLKIIWWVLVESYSLICLTDGFDMGSMALMPLLVKLITNAVLLLIQSHPLGW